MHPAFPYSATDGSGDRAMTLQQFQMNKANASARVADNGGGLPPS